MNPVIIAALIGALATIGATISTFLLTRFDSISFPSTHTMQNPLAGEWEGCVEREEQQGPPTIMQFNNAKFKTFHRVMRGEGTLQFQYQNEDIYPRLVIRGRFTRDRCLEFAYETTDSQGSIQHGVGMLALSGDGKTLDGSFAGHSGYCSNPMGEIVRGSVHMHRHGKGFTQHTP